MDLNRLLALRKEGKTIYQIALKCGVSKETVRRGLHALKLPKLSRVKGFGITDEQFSEAVLQSNCIASVLRFLGRSLVGTNYRRVLREATRLKLDTSHWKGQGCNSYGKLKTRRPWSEVLTENSPYKLNQRRKSALIRDGLLRNVCYLCNLKPEWNGHLLVLRLDHVNGIRNDNRHINIRLVCPNCDSQLPTYCGRNKKRVVSLAG